MDHFCKIKKHIDYMDLIQSAATLALLALLTYFVMVNVDPSRKFKPLRSVGDVQEAEQKLMELQNTQVQEEVAKHQLPQSQSEPFSSNSEMITNRIDLDANKAIPSTGITEQALVQDKPELSVQTPHARNVLGGHSGSCLSTTENGKCNTDDTQIHSVFNKQAKGILPSNHDIFDKPADFGSDVTNINQFYKNNPDIFEKSHINVPNVTEWSDQGKQLYNAVANSKQGPINAYNFEQSVLAK
jgi:hypothetical protein